jgi:hypothetical protein
MSYKPPFCELTGILIERCQQVKLNKTTSIAKDEVVFTGQRYIEKVSSNPAVLSAYGLQEANGYIIYLQSPDSVCTGDKIWFNKSSYRKSCDYIKWSKDKVKLVVKQIEDCEMDSEGYIEVLALSNN